jgi:hypothetical protein
VARLEVYAPKRMLREAEELAAAARLILGAEAEVYALPDDFAYRLELARAYAPDRVAQLLERGVLAAPAVVLAGAPPRPLFLGRLPSLAELAAALRLPAVPPVEVEEILVEPPVGGARPEGETAAVRTAVGRGEGAAQTQTPAPAETPQPAEPQLVVETEDAVREAAAEEEGRPRRGRGRRRRR